MVFLAIYRPATSDKRLTTIMPFFSIIIPVYNVAPYLRECLDSVLAQTFTDWEAICVDDGSSDGSGAILDEYAARDERFRVIHQANAGVSVARNVALGLVCGMYVCFIDGDDVVLPWHLFLVNELICRLDFPDLVREVRSLPYDLRHEVKEPKTKNVQIRIIESQDVFPFVTKEVIRNGLLVLNFFRATKIKGVEFPAGVKFAEDGLFFCRTICRIKRICFAEVATYCYRENRLGCATRNVDYDDAIRFIAELVDVFAYLRKQLPYVGKGIAIAFTNFLMKIFKRFRMGAGVGSGTSQKAYFETLRRIAKTEFFDDSEIPIGYRLAFRFFLVTGSYCPFRIGRAFFRGVRSVRRLYKLVF